MPHYRNPNGYGSVVKLSGNRRRPFMVRKTIGYDDRAYPIYEVIGYYSTRMDAMLALAEYNADPYDIQLSKITMKGLYEMWSAEAFPNMKKSIKACYAAAYKHCAPVYGKEYKTLRRGHMQLCIDTCDRGYSTRSNIKLLFTQLDRFAYDHDIISKCYAANLKVGEKEESTKHRLVTDEEVLALWKLQGDQFVDETLFLLYTGCRVSEMLRLRCRNISFENMTMIGGLKTVYGRDRVIPIHPELLPIVRRYYDPAHEFLFQRKANQDTDNFSKWYGVKWAEAMKAIGFDHLTHDCRHTVRSKLDAAGANKVAIDRIIGHSSNSIGEKVYTHKTVAELQEAIRLLSYSSSLVTDE